jgi:hypothetical protein
MPLLCVSNLLSPEIRNHSVTKKKSITDLDRPLAVQEVEDPRIFKNRHMKGVRLSAIRTGRLHLQEVILVLIYVKG